MTFLNTVRLKGVTFFKNNFSEAKKYSTRNIKTSSKYIFFTKIKNVPLNWGFTFKKSLV